MTSLRQDVATKISTEGKQGACLLWIFTYYNFPASHKFVNEYYPALNSVRGSIQSFYVSPSIMPDGKSLPTIVFNGNNIQDPASMQNLFQEQMPQTRFEVQNYDCHVLNPEYITDATQAASSSPGKNMTILLSVSGYVKYGEPRSVEPRGFSETFVLVPNPNVKPSNRNSHPRGWVIQNQIFRQVS